MTTIAMATKTGELHGLIQTLPNSVPYDDFKKCEKAEDRTKLKKELENRKKIVKGRYINRQNSNERLEKAYCAGSGEPLQLWKLIPDYTYELPLGFVEEVNASGMPVRADLVSIDGAEVNKDASPLVKDRMERIHEIVPVGF
jgi:hypothetical protein